MRSEVLCHTGDQSITEPVSDPATQNNNLTETPAGSTYLNNDASVEAKPCLRVLSCVSMCARVRRRGF